MLVKQGTFERFVAPMWESASFRHGFGVKNIPVRSYLSADFIPETKQIHTDVIHYISSKPEGPLEGDAFITDQPGVVCWVRTADCVPILLVDPVRKVVAAVHAGWKGTVARIVQKTVQRMQKDFGSRPEEMQAAVGPAICGRCYLVQRDVFFQFEKALFLPANWCEAANEKQWHLDLGRANFELLIASGLRHEDIYFSMACTMEDENRLASYRREKEKRGEQVSYICL